MGRRPRRCIAVSLLIIGGCAPVEAGRSPSTAPAAAAVATLIRSGTTVTGQPLGPVDAPWEAVISRSELPPGGVLPMHKHPWPRYAFVLRGRLRVSYEESGLIREFGAGEAVIEAVDQWHEGRVVGDEPVTLIVFDQVPPGRANVVPR